MDGHSTSLAVVRDDQPKQKFVHATDLSCALATQNPRTVQFEKKTIFSHTLRYIVAIYDLATHAGPPFCLKFRLISSNDRVIFLHI